MQRAQTRKQQILRAMAADFARAIQTGNPEYLAASTYHLGLAQWKYGEFLRDVQLPSGLNDQERTAATEGAARLLVPATSEAQQPTRRRAQTIEIRGQVPTPQVVTVRPREVPAYSRNVISPNFFDRDFWPSIVPGYQLVAQQVITGAVPVGADSAALRAPATTPGTTTPGTTTPGTTTPGTTTPTGGTPQGMTVRPPPTGTPLPNLQRTTAPGDTTRAPNDSTRAPNDTTAGASGTPPARPRR